MTIYRITQQSALTGRTTIWEATHECYIWLAGRKHHSYHENITQEYLKKLFDTIPDGIEAGMTEINGTFYKPEDAPFKSELEWADNVHGFASRDFKREIIND